MHQTRYPSMAITHHYWVPLMLLGWGADPLNSMITGWCSWGTWVTVNYPETVITIMADLPNMNLNLLQGPSNHLGVPDGWAMDTFTRLQRFYGAAAHRGDGVVIIAELRE